MVFKNKNFQEEITMELYEAIARRRTVRGFTQPASAEALNRIILAGSMAASPINSQPWEFIVLDDSKLIEQIAEHKYQQNQKLFPGPSAVAQKNNYKNSSPVAVCYKKGYGNRWAAWMCIQNMYLAATAEGLGIVPSEIWGEDQIAVEKLLGLPEDYKMAAVVLVGRQKGYPKVPKLKRRKEWSWLHRNRFGVKPSSLPKSKTQ
jgi:nitroreductase